MDCFTCIVGSVSQEAAIEICKEIYPKLSAAGFYPALTGGSLYKEGLRKDVDIVIYRNRQSVLPFEMVEIKDLLIELGFTNLEFFGFVTKSQYKGVSVDIFNPESTAGGDYHYESR